MFGRRFHALTIESRRRGSAATVEVTSSGGGAYVLDRNAWQVWRCIHSGQASRTAVVVVWWKGPAVGCDLGFAAEKSSTHPRLFPAEKKAVVPVVRLTAAAVWFCVRPVGWLHRMEGALDVSFSRYCRSTVV